ncbi:MAG: hypothetical protein B7Z63_01975 [Ignavibacteriae bacterium 37-53-5]|nr:MAG: hypothetical protein B7Z63_01975 [Ignavibacteriae bacterium 37-53-5]
MIRELVKTKLRLLYLEGGERVSRHLARSLFSVVTFAIFAYLTYGVIEFATKYLIVQAKIGLFLYHRLLALALFVFFAIISIANILVAFVTIFRNTEAEFLPLVAALGVVFSILPLILSAACAGAIILLLVLKISQKISIKTAVVAVTLLYAGSTYSYVMLNNPFRLFNDVMKYYPHIDRYLGVLDPKLDYLAPSFWSANFFYFATTGNYVGAAASALIVCAVAALLFFVMIKLADKYYEEAFWTARHKLFERKVKNPGDPFAEQVRGKGKAISLLKRDFLLFIREPSQTFHFGVLMLLIGIFLMNLFEMRMYLPDTFVVSSAFTLIYAFNSFLVVSLAVRFVYPMLSLEGETMWLMRSSPVSLARVFYAKILPSIIFLSAIGAMLGIAAPSPFKNFHGLIPTSIVYGTVGGIIFPSLVMIFGGAFVDYKEKNAVRISSSHGATVSLLVSVGLMVILSSIVFNQTFHYFSSKGRVPVDLSGAWILGLIGVACFYLARFFAVRALKIDM